MSLRVDRISDPLSVLLSKLVGVLQHVIKATLSTTDEMNDGQPWQCGRVCAAIHSFARKGSVPGKASGISAATASSMKAETGDPWKHLLC